MKSNITILLIFIIYLTLFGSTASASVINNKAFITSKNGGDISFGPTNVLKNSPYIYFSKEIIKEKEDSTWTQSFTVLPSTTSISLELPFKFSNKEYITLYKDPSGKKFNAGHISNNKNESLGLFFISTEKIQNKLQLTTNVRDKNILELKIETKKLLEPVTITIEITSPDIDTYFDNNDWIKRGNLHSVSMKPSTYLLASANYEISTLKRLDAWNKLVEIHKTNEKWSNIEGLQNQFDCHFNFAKTKGEWNLEPARKNVGYFSTVMSSCNPSTK
ncbi:DUF2599 domain-containing protein [Psychrobacillus sp. FSL W7-1457]|uniref:DUF2599 domain-containing protein n=1 Tax=unclassified Psychrobacillus TaxID=2636677 RepID=UPI0030FAC8D0